MMSTKKPNLILSTVWGYSFVDLEPFLSTLRRTGYEGDVVFLCSQMAPKTLQKLQSAGVQVVPFARPFPYLGPDLAEHNHWGEMPDAGFFFFCLRHLLYYCFLKEHGAKYQNIFLTDVRDVIFQGDPFGFPITGLTGFEEKEGVSIKEQSSNRAWILGTFGPEVFEYLKDKSIICAGTTYGPVDAMLTYLDAMVSTIFKQNGSNNDQGVHNFVIHTGLVTNVTVYQNNDGPVLNIGIEDTVRLNNTREILNLRNQVPPVVHQYDRHYAIAKHYYSRRLRMKLWWAHNSPASTLRRWRYHFVAWVRDSFPAVYIRLRQLARGT
jgi:hypothetical protein